MVKATDFPERDHVTVRDRLHESFAKTGAARLLIIVANASRQTVA
jgi:hypothetical protein